MARRMIVRSLIVLFALSFGAPSWAMDIIAHRGASHYAPENTVRAAWFAWAQGADCLEFDVHLTKDGHAVVFHDRTLRRTTGVWARLAVFTLDELRTLDAGSWLHPSFRGETIPTLEEMLATVPDHGRVFIEAKVGGPILKRIEEAVARSHLDVEQITVIGFDLKTMKRFKRRNPSTTTLWLTILRPLDCVPIPYSVPTEDALSLVIEAGLDGINVRDSSRVCPAFIRSFREAGLSVHVWTINCTERARQLMRMGVCGITTDRPGLMRRMRDYDH